MEDNEFDAYTRDAVRELREKIESFHSLHGLDTKARRWEVDLHQVPATLRFFDKSDKLALICEVVEIGSYSPPTNSWVWGWSNNSVPPDLQAKALPLKQLQQTTGKDYFGFESPIAANLEFAWQLAAISVKHLSALGCYDARMEDGRLYVFLAIIGARSGT